jgi:XRE family transcriptional regulator, regulator of sulfur utilization
VCMAAAGAALAVAGSTGAMAQAGVLSSTVFDWSNMKADKTKVGEVRQVVQAPTATLDELEIHITTLNPGQTSHAPHQHPAEEIIIIKEGTVESLVNGETKRVGPGSIVFQASNQLHGIRNVGDAPATYHVVQWKSPNTIKK